MYGEKEAVVYDALYGRIKDYEAESHELAGIIRSLNPIADSLLDVGCGTGNHLAFLASSFRVEGVEPSPAMAARARRRLGGRPVHELDMRELDLGRRFDAVVCLFSSIGYMPSTDDLDRAVAAMARHMNRDGVLVVEPWFDRKRWFKLEEGRVGVNMVESDAATECNPGSDGAGAMVVRMVRCWAEGPMSHMEMHYLLGRGESIVHFVEHHRLRLFSDDEYRAAFERAGLTVERRTPGLTGRGLYIGAPDGA